MVAQLPRCVLRNSSCFCECAACSAAGHCWDIYWKSLVNFADVMYGAEFSTANALPEEHVDIERGIGWDGTVRYDYVHAECWGMIF